MATYDLAKKNAGRTARPLDPENTSYNFIRGGRPLMGSLWEGAPTLRGWVACQHKNLPDSPKNCMKQECILVGRTPSTAVAVSGDVSRGEGVRGVCVCVCPGERGVCVCVPGGRVCVRVCVCPRGCIQEEGHVCVCVP